MGWLGGAGVAVGAVVVLVATAGCGGAGPAGSGAGGTGADQRYGAAPTRHPEVTYQPEVVLVAGGGAAVRSVSDDALTWRIDPGADGADEVARGRIMFLTGRAVGRVLDVRRDGRDLAVTLGPVDITEVIRDGVFSGDRPLDTPVRYEADSPFWAELDAGPGEFPSARTPEGVTRTAAVRNLPAGPSALRPAVAAIGRSAPSPGFRVTPVCCAGGVGARFSYDGGDVRIAGSATLLMGSPSASFHLEIRGGRVLRAQLQVRGMVGLRLDIAAATTARRNVNKRLAVPVDFSVPIGEVLGVPFSATASQTIGVQTAFSARDGNIKASAEWSLSGALGFGYANGSFSPQLPGSFAVRNSIVDSMTGPSVGVNGIIVTHQAAFRLGLGAFGFTAGLYATLTTTVGLTVGSAAGAPLALCRGAQLGIWTDYGVGYTIPGYLAKAINAFLDLFNATPIEQRGGIGKVDSVYQKYVVQPDVKLCR
ncbi:hypothetical protein SAMN05444365_109149 [Micromonospora pattaloongensis]|uniref:Uncharacterized protein n=1 Tax=Micromonospora pattaloongensis TaxID=405436 RepID=A0A1H3RY73_9ACTN|nr:hypothetical protein [Micromonospora pattaloongensis]SDZ30211.1 hypothetical protein SAMN05444365_109149 [Micromonospora pattaloongensis]